MSKEGEVSPYARTSLRATPSAGLCPATPRRGVTNPPVPPIIDLPKVFTNVPKVFTDVPKVFTDALKVFTDALKVFTDVPKVFTDVPKVFTDAPKVFTDAPKVFTDVLNGLPGKGTPKEDRSILCWIPGGLGRPSRNGALIFTAAYPARF
ncbi:MAG: hypothetical protein LBD37_04030 [Treponema sp.]|jgi:hypothetical protein|nr:hypothetical protein [Treponema sp.]